MDMARYYERVLHEVSDYHSSCGREQPGLFLFCGELRRLYNTCSKAVSLDKCQLIKLYIWLLISRHTLDTDKVHALNDIQTIPWIMNFTKGRRLGDHPHVSQIVHAMVSVINSPSIAQLRSKDPSLQDALIPETESLGRQPQKV